MSRNTSKKLPENKNDPLRVKVFPHDFVNKTTTPPYPTSEMCCLSGN